MYGDGGDTKDTKNTGGGPTVHRYLVYQVFDIRPNEEKNFVRAQAAQQQQLF